MLNLQQVPRFRRAVDPPVEVQGFDELTGVAGRGLFMGRLEAQWCWASEQQLSISLLLINIDGFQAFSAQASQAQVDEALAQIAVAIAESCQRRSDLVGRIRDDEFGVILADVDLQGTHGMAERLRARIAELQIDDGQGGHLQVCIGGTSGVPLPNRFPHSLQIAADHALRAAKQKGPGHIEVAAQD